MARKLAMGTKELTRGKLMAMVSEKKITLKEAASRLGISYRQAKRIKSDYQKDGDEGLLHGNQGKASNRAIEAEVKAQILSTYRERYPDFGPTFAAEKLEEVEGLKVSSETLRQWLVKEGLWQRKRKRSEHRSRRDRRPSFGDLVQFDGSHHDWFEGRRMKCCLINMVDDATGKTLSMLFEQETTEGAMRTLWAWIGLYGLPKALYCDKKNAFVLTREPTEDEIKRGITKPKSHFGKACEKLGIEVIAANSPQAKGRVERNHGVYQDRFVKELRLAGISTIEAANKFLFKTYLPKINAKFEVAPADSADGHAPLLGVDLREIFVFEHTRSVSNDYVVKFECAQFQILKENKITPRPKDKVVIRIRLDGSKDIYWQGKRLKTKEIQPENKEDCLTKAA
jgi:transposase